MSVRVMTAVWSIDLPDSDKIVLLALADCANDEGGCWPSIKTLTAKCSKTDRTIQASIKSLVAARHLTREEVPGKGCRYVVHPCVDAKNTPETASPRKDCPPKGTTQTPEAASDKPSRTITSPKRATRLPDDFEVPSEWIEWAMAKRNWPEADAKDEAENFCSYWQARPGKDATKLDWRKTFENWIRSSRRQTKPPDREGASPQSGYLEHISSKYQRAA